MGESEKEQEIWANLIGVASARLEPMIAEFPSNSTELTDGVNDFEYVGNLVNAKSKPVKKRGEITYRGLFAPFEKRIDSFVARDGSFYINKGQSRYKEVTLHRIKQLYESGMLNFEGRQ